MPIVEVGAVPIVEARLSSTSPSSSPSKSSNSRRSSPKSSPSRKQPASPRLSKKQQQRGLLKQDEQYSHGTLLCGLIGCLYLVAALCFYFHQYMVDPTSLQRLWGSGALTTHIVTVNVPGAPHSPTVHIPQIGISKFSEAHPPPPLQDDQHQNAQGTLVVPVHTQNKKVAFNTHIKLHEGKANGVKYLRCDIANDSRLSGQRTDLPTTNGESRDVVFLDTTHFQTPIANLYTKTSSILQLCTKGTTSGLLDSVTVLEMHGTEEPKKLMQTLEALKARNLVTSLPVAALVTPGKSSSLILEWILYEDVASLQHKMARHWIPASAGATIWQAFAEEDYESDLQRRSHPLRVIENWSVLPLHCEEDDASRRASRLLERVALAQPAAVSGDGGCLTSNPSGVSDALLVMMRDHLPPLEWASNVQWTTGVWNAI